MGGWGGDATPLTTREREVADLITAGLSNRQIATKLYAEGGLLARELGAWRPCPGRSSCARR